MVTLAMDERGSKKYRVKDAVTAGQAVFEFIRPDIVDSMAKGSTLRTLPEGITAGVRFLAKHKHARDLRVGVDYIQGGAAL
jgi:hypothetical protein